MKGGGDYDSWAADLDPWARPPPAAAPTTAPKPGSTLKERGIKMSSSHVPGHLQVADVGTKPLPAHKLLGLSIVNVRMPLETRVPPTAAKFFARIGRMSPESATVVSPA